MKNLFTLVFCALSVFMSFNVNAQCTPDPSFTEAGLYPVPDSLDCIVQGEPFEVIVQFKNFDQAGSFTIDSLRIDSLTNLPCGSTYQVSEADRTFDGGQTGCLRIFGTTSDAVGQYKLGIFVTVSANGTPNLLSGEASDIAAAAGAGDFSYYVRVVANSGDACPVIDSTDSDNKTASCATVYDPTTSVNELASNINSFRFYPNPATSVANVSFVSDKFTQYTTRIVNIFGQEMSRETLDVEAGVNNIQVNVSSLPTGVYMYTINDGKAAFTHRFIVN